MGPQAVRTAKQALTVTETHTRPGGSHFACAKRMTSRVCICFGVPPPRDCHLLPLGVILISARVDCMARARVGRQQASSIRQPGGHRRQEFVLYWREFRPPYRRAGFDSPQPGDSAQCGRRRRRERPLRCNDRARRVFHSALPNTFDLPFRVWWLGWACVVPSGGEKHALCCEMAPRRPWFRQQELPQHPPVCRIPSGERFLGHSGPGRGSIGACDRDCDA